MFSSKMKSEVRARMAFQIGRFSMALQFPAASAGRGSELKVMSGAMTGKSGHHGTQVEGRQQIRSFKALELLNNFGNQIFMDRSGFPIYASLAF